MFDRIKQQPSIRAFYYNLTAPIRGTRLRLNRNVLREAVAVNRSFLDTIPMWVEDQTYASSLFQYGLPEHIRSFIDDRLSCEPTYTDAMVCVSKRLTKPIRYLELGVSVGKNFGQVLNAFEDAELVGFEIEDINPVLERLLNKLEETSWPTMEASIRNRPSRLAMYDFPSRKNKVTYLSGDIFDENSWQKLAGRKFNLIFSDAFHSVDALWHEWKMIRELDLIDRDEFIMFWDDLNGEMRRGFFDIAREMTSHYGLPESAVSVELFRGWVGAAEPHHPVGIIRKLRG